MESSVQEALHELVERVSAQVRADHSIDAFLAMVRLNIEEAAELIARAPGRE